MPKRVQLDAVGAKLELEHFQAPAEPEQAIQAPAAWHDTPWWLRLVGGALVLAIIVTASFELVYAGKVLPGVSADGVDVSGMDVTAATSVVQAKIATFNNSVITIKADGNPTSVGIGTLGLTYDVNDVIDQATSYGRTGSLWHKISQQFTALIGGHANVTSYTYNQAALAAVTTPLDDQIVTPAVDAAVNFNGNQAQVAPAQPGSRLDLGRLVLDFDQALATMSTAAITAPVYQLNTALATGPLTAALSQIDADVAGPISVNDDGTFSTIDQATIISWMDVTATAQQPFLSSLKLADIYPMPSAVNIGLDPAKVQAYVATLAQNMDQPATDAGLSWENGQVVVTSPSQNGLAVDQTDAYNQILTALAATGSARQVTLKVASTPAAVNENNLASLGITQQLSEGITNYYPSSASRINNFSLATAKFNDVLLSPGETFSFGKILGPAGLAQGYTMGFVILANKEVPAPGGGICQVVTTAFRAALLAGLPITDRLNHAFAISYYLWPYAIPGVDATIYYPELDLQFVNDTGHYILIQTNVNKSNDTLTFDFYGTKTKVGVIRGPYYVTSNGTLSSDPNYANANESSHTVFYQDIEDLNGNVIKTNTFNSYYKPQSDFPPESD